MTALELDRKLSLLHPTTDSSQLNLLLTVDADENRVEGLFFLYNLWTTAVDSPTFQHDTLEVDKNLLFKFVISHQLLAVFFSVDVLDHLLPGDADSLALFVQQILHFILINSANLEEPEFACMSHIILLTWWAEAFTVPENYRRMGNRLLDGFANCVTQVSAAFLKQLSRFPEHANLFVTQVLRLYVSESSLQKSDSTEEDTASRMLGIHSTPTFQHLAHLYRKSLSNSECPSPSNVHRCDRPALVTLLDSIVRCGLVDCLRQRPDISLTLGTSSPLLLERFTLVRDYFLTRACRHLANDIHHDLSIQAHASKLSCFIYAASPKHLVAKLLTPKSSGSDRVEEAFDPHCDLICWALDHQLCIKDYATWFVSFSDVKDVKLANCLIQRLMKHTSVFSPDHVFPMALIQRIDRVRKSALPEQEYVKLLRQILVHMSPETKSTLLEELHSSPGSPTPLPKSKTHLEVRTRHLFNRLTVSEQETEYEEQSARATSQRNSSFNHELLLDSELILLTRPIDFLVELISFPLAQHRTASQPAVHQLLSHLSYCLSVRLKGLSKQPSEDPGDCSQQSGKTILEHLFNVDSTGNKKRSLLDNLELAEDDYEDLFSFQCVLESLSARHVSFPSVLKHPIVRTVAHLIQLSPTQIPTLIHHVTGHLKQSNTPHDKSTENLVLVYLSALLIDQSILESVDRSLLLSECIDLFWVLCSCTSLHCAYELDSLTAYLMVQLQSSSVADSPVTDRFVELENQLTSRCQLPKWNTVRPWIVWSSWRKNLLRDHSPECVVFPREAWSLFPNLGEFLSVDRLRDDFGITFADMVPTENSSTSAISPRTLYFVFFLASQSPPSLEHMVRMLTASDSESAQCWTSDRITPGSLLTAFMMLLKSQSEQPEQWVRTVVFLHQLVKSGIIVLPFKLPRSSSRPCYFALIDWSVTTGFFDTLSFFSDLFRLWIVQTNPTEETSCTLICHTLIYCTQHLAKCLTDLSKQSSQYKWYRTVGEGLLNVLKERAQRLSKRVDSAPCASNAIERLCLSIDSALESLNQQS